MKVVDLEVGGACGCGEPFTYIGEGIQLEANVFELSNPFVCPKCGDPIEIWFKSSKKKIVSYAVDWAAKAEVQR